MFENKISKTEDLYRWGHPISLVLYGTIFDSNPVERAETDAESFVAEYTPDQLQILVDEIKFELRNPTQQVRDIHDCRASEAQLREFLRLFTNHVERQLRRS